MLKKRIVKKKGLTLVELMVTISLIGVVIAIASSIFLGNNKIFNKGVAQYDVQSNARVAMTDITNSVRYATFIEILPDTVVLPEADTLGENEGYIYYDSTSGGIINKKKSSSSVHIIGTAEGSGVTFKASNSDFSLGISIKGIDVSQEFEVESSVLCLNMKIYSTNIEGISSGGIIHYKKNISTPTVTATPTIIPTITQPVTPTPVVVPNSKITLTITYTQNSNNASHTYNYDLTAFTDKKISSVASTINTTNRCGDVTTVGEEDTTDVKMNVNSVKKKCQITLEVILNDGSKQTFKLYYNGTWSVNAM